MKDDRYVVGIFQEYCDKVDMQLGGDAVEVVVQGKYFTELYTRVMLHGWAVCQLCQMITTIKLLHLLKIV